MSAPLQACLADASDRLNLLNEGLSAVDAVLSGSTDDDQARAVVAALRALAFDGANEAHRAMVAAQASHPTAAAARQGPSDEHGNALRSARELLLLLAAGLDALVDLLRDADPVTALRTRAVALGLQRIAKHEAANAADGLSVLGAAA